MKYRTLILALVASGMMAPAFAGEISLPEYHLAITLPDGWQQLSGNDTIILVRAQADSTRLRFVFVRAPLPVKPESVQDSGFQSGVKRSLLDQGFVRIVRSEVIKVAGSDAYLCEAAREDKPYSVIKVVWFHEGHSMSLNFASFAKSFKDVPDIRTIIDSVKVLPKS